MLKSPPNEKHLSRMYYELAHVGAQCVGDKSAWPYQTKNLEGLLVLAAEMSRYDPRLLGILVEFLIKHAFKINPHRFRNYYAKMETPQTIALIAEFVKNATPSIEVRYLMDYLQKGLRPVLTQLYFKNLYSPGGKWMQRAAEESLAQYKKWGFLALESPSIDVYNKKTVGHPDANSRRNILKRLFEEKKQIQMKDYLKHLGGNISRQQALKDLGDFGRLKGKGRGAVWMVKQ
jgi:hypothetical protein